MPDLPETMQALVLTAPRAALELREVPVPKPGPGEVLVKLAASPINPSDLHFLDGEYGLAWPYPLIPGLEGSGQVVAAGPGIMGRYVLDKPVSCTADTQGCWAEYMVTQAGLCLPLPADLPLGLAAMGVVNPLTAVAFLQIAKQDGHRALISTAAGGALGAMIRRMGEAQGVDVINVVRGAQQVERLKAEGATYVLDLTNADFDAELAAACKTTGCRLALDAIGGVMTGRLVEALRPRGEVLVYGALDGAASQINPGTLLFREIVVRGFWVSKWIARKSLPQKMLIMRQVVKALQDGAAQSHVAHIIDLAEAATAPAAYAADMSAGKTLISTGAFPLGVEPSQ
ncbi:zinc-binding dehydrogenase [Rhodophyticola sp.]|uniref:zinc-binding dehydrogenase n=1 Tax=Rhodophyticola sp. TaxID=2680032 RepID=UPI001B0A80CD|nr:zinc-binding dehydrogenase [Roseicyclus sp.]MBO6626421.1 zinc-binding dehydrogenase [Roseicyclus sp.]MBO6924265.1 zinc-binding dehydrogenase [Roseicyclus sp.]